MAQVLDLGQPYVPVEGKGGPGYAFTLQTGTEDVRAEKVAQAVQVHVREGTDPIRQIMKGLGAATGDRKVMGPAHAPAPSLFHGRVSARPRSCGRNRARPLSAGASCT